MRHQHTGPGFKHVVDEEFDEARLRLWNVACAAVEYRHDDRQTAIFLVIRLFTIAHINFSAKGKKGKVTYIVPKPHILLLHRRRASLTE